MDKRKTASLIKYSISDRNILNKTLQTNTRYANVKAKINSGFNEKRRHEIELEMKKYYKVKSDEVFRRVSLIDLLNLMLVFAEECALHSLATTELEPRPEPINTNDNKSVGAHAALKEPVSPFLILDVRSENEFDKGHLATAVCYPHSKLSKAFNWESADMLLYKNHPDWIIVICDENENLSPGVATTLINRGYDNSFVLSGGLKLANDKIGPPLITANESRVLALETAEFLFETVSSTLKPSNNTLQWLFAKKTDSANSGNEPPATGNVILIPSIISCSTKGDKEDKL